MVISFRWISRVSNSVADRDVNHSVPFIVRLALLVVLDVDSWGSVMASPAFKEELSLLGSVTCFSKSFTSPSVLHFPSPKLWQITSSFTCSLHRILCVVQPDGELHLPAALDSNLCFHFQRCFLRSTFLSSAALAWAHLSASSSSSGAPEQQLAAFVDPCLSHFGECLTELASSYSLNGLVTLVVKKLGWEI
ncbi:hypothetical protein HID58_066203 [Brassica napus]|uniref:Uncharacterized protein n=3 Tax=Brassica TaxID=3705 RepID=A0ABQ7ZF04_BRANA|nr:hypothetical protein HID58_066203 [Brassica napus]